MKTATDYIREQVTKNRDLRIIAYARGDAMVFRATLNARHHGEEAAGNAQYECAPDREVLLMDVIARAIRRAEGARAASEATPGLRVCQHCGAAEGDLHTKTCPALLSAH